MDAVYLIVGRVFLFLIFEKDRFAIGQINERQWIGVGLITARNSTSVMFGLFGNIISRNIYFFTFGFEHTDRFPVYKKKIVGFQVVLKQSLTYGNSS